MSGRVTKMTEGEMRRRVARLVREAADKEKATDAWEASVKGLKDAINVVLGAGGDLVAVGGDDPATVEQMRDDLAWALVSHGGGQSSGLDPEALLDSIVSREGKRGSSRGDRPDFPSSSGKRF